MTILKCENCGEPIIEDDYNDDGICSICEYTHEENRIENRNDRD